METSHCPARTLTSPADICDRLNVALILCAESFTHASLLLIFQKVLIDHENSQNKSEGMECSMLVLQCVDCNDIDHVRAAHVF